MCIRIYGAFMLTGLFRFYMVYTGTFFLMENAEPEDKKNLMFSLQKNPAGIRYIGIGCGKHSRNVEGTI